MNVKHSLAFSILLCIFTVIVICVDLSHISQYKVLFSYLNQSMNFNLITKFQINNQTNLTNQFFNNHKFYELRKLNHIQKCLCEKENGDKKSSKHNKGLSLIFWRNSTFISQKNANYSYYNLLKTAKPSGKPCNKGYKRCGILDSFNQTLCLLINETCPLNQIEFSNSSIPSDIFINKNVVNTVLLKDNITYLHTSNAEINSPVITRLVVGPKSFCMIESERGTGEPRHVKDFFFSKW